MTIQEEFEAKVATIVARRLQDKPWFRGVCMDKFAHHQHHYSYTEGDIDDAVEDVYLNTLYWDAPNYGL